MGSYSSKLPVTEKNLKDVECNVFKVGLGEMQGWRGNMEDASLIHIAKKHSSNTPTTVLEEEALDESHSSSEDSTEQSTSVIFRELKIHDERFQRELKKEIKTRSPENNISIIGVFDGHGGSFISRFVAENFMTVFNNSWIKSYIKSLANDNQLRSKTVQIQNIDFEQFNAITIDKLEQVLIQTFLDFDELLLSKELESMVMEYKTYKRDDLILPSIPKILSEESQNDLCGENFAYFMGTTANIVCFYENFLVVANVGDSMSVLYTDGKAIELNTEHKVSTPGEEERILKSGLTVHNNRIEGKLNLTRAIGDLQFKNRKLRPHERAVTAYPEFTTYELNERSEFLITACDGIWDCVEPQKLCEFVSREIKRGKKLSKIIESIEDMVLSKTNNSPIGTDNMTCLILQFK